MSGMQRKAEIEAAFHKLGLTEFLTPKAQLLSDSLQLVNTKNLEIRCQGKCKNGGCCSRVVAKERVLGGVMGLQVIALDRDVVGEELEKRLTTLYREQLLCTTSNHDVQAPKKAKEAAKIIGEVRRKLGQPAVQKAYTIPVSQGLQENFFEQGFLGKGPSKNVTAKELEEIKNERDSANAKMAELADAVEDLEIENGLWRAKAKELMKKDHDKATKSAHSNSDKKAATPTPSIKVEPGIKAEANTNVEPNEVPCGFSVRTREVAAGKSPVFQFTNGTTDLNGEGDPTHDQKSNHTVPSAFAGLEHDDADDWEADSRRRN